MVVREKVSQHFAICLRHEIRHHLKNKRTSLNFYLVNLKSLKSLKSRSTDIPKLVPSAFEIISSIIPQHTTWNKWKYGCLRLLFKISAKRKGVCWKEGTKLRGGFLFSSTDSAVVEAWKVINKMAVETDFSYNLVIQESEGGGGHLFKRCNCLIQWPQRSAHIRGMVLIKVWALIWENKVSLTFSSLFVHACQIKV